MNGVRVRLWHWDPGTRELIIDDDIDALGIPGEVAGIEVYGPTSKPPAEFGGASDGCGAIAIWTR